MNKFDDDKTKKEVSNFFNFMEIIDIFVSVNRPSYTCILAVFTKQLIKFIDASPTKQDDLKFVINTLISKKGVKMNKFEDELKELVNKHLDLAECSHEIQRIGDALIFYVAQLSFHAGGKDAQAVIKERGFRMGWAIKSFINFMDSFEEKENEDDDQSMG